MRRPDVPIDLGERASGQPGWGERRPAGIPIGELAAGLQPASVDADDPPHELRAADYDDWVTETVSADGRPMHGLNGDILVWNPVTKRRHELTSMGIRVNAETLRQQLEITGQTDWLTLPYHKGIISGELPLSIGGGIGQSRTQMLLLKKAHLGEVSVTVWPQILKDMCAERDIFVIE